MRESRNNASPSTIFRAPIHAHPSPLVDNDRHEQAGSIKLSINQVQGHGFRSLGTDFKLTRSMTSSNGHKILENKPHYPISQHHIFCKQDRYYTVKIDQYFVARPSVRSIRSNLGTKQVCIDPSLRCVDRSKARVIWTYFPTFRGH